MRAMLNTGLVAALLAVAAPAAAQPPVKPAQFAQMAAQSDKYEILAAQVAVIQSRDPRVKAFVQDMIQAHGQTTAALKQAAARSGLPPPPDGMGDDQSHMLYALQGAPPGPEFDKLYAAQQVVAHQGALTVEQDYAQRGSDPNLWQAASQAVPIIQHHLQMARQMKSAVGG